MRVPKKPCCVRVQNTPREKRLNQKKPSSRVRELRRSLCYVPHSQDTKTVDTAKDECGIRLLCVLMTSQGRRLGSIGI